MSSADDSDVSDDSEDSDDDFDSKMASAVLNQASESSESDSSCSDTDSSPRRAKSILEGQLQGDGCECEEEDPLHCLLPPMPPEIVEAIELQELNRDLRAVSTADSEDSLHGAALRSSLEGFIQDDITAMESVLNEMRKDPQGTELRRRALILPLRSRSAMAVLGLPKDTPEQVRLAQESCSIQ